MLEITPPIVALLTPFNAVGTIDWRAFKSYLDALAFWGVKSVIANGTTGEFPSLTLEERQQVSAFVRRHFEGAVIDNVSSTCTADVKTLIAGTHGDAVLLLPPYYYADASIEGLYRFFETTLSENTLPAFAYNFPKHTGNRIDPDLIEMLIRKGIRLDGLKDSAGDLRNALAYRSRFPELQVFFADDAGCLEALQNGLHGSITGGANPLPEYLLAIQEAWARGSDKAQALQCAFDAWNHYRTASSVSEIPLVKAAMGARIREFSPHVRPPLVSAPADAVGGIRIAVLERLADLRAILNGP